MRSRTGQLGVGVLAAAAAAAIAIAAARVEVAAAENTGFISGVVTSGKGPEAGVWVIAETKDFPAKLRKIVVTDDQGRFVLPELPPAQFDLWVRGYGLTDSKPMTAKSGQQNVKLAAVLARTPQEAAQSYPSNYWLSMINLPAASEFPGTGPKGQRHRAGDDRSERVDQQPQRLHTLPSGRQQADADRSRSGQVPVRRGGLGSPRAARPAWRVDELVHDRLRPRARPEDVR